MKHGFACMVLLCATFAASCGDPVHDGEVDALGPEKGDPGPEHRPGQPCLVCHGGSGPASTHFSIGGTAYQVQGAHVPLVGAQVSMVDANGVSHTLKTNSAGNFYASADNWQPANPIHGVTITYQGVVAQMATNIGRDGSCADCHFDPAGPTTHGSIYLVEDPSDLPGAMP
jgi:hypothetical protein